MSKKATAAAASRHRRRLSSSSEAFANLITAALKSHKKQEQSKLIDEVKNDVMGLIQAKLLGSGGSDAAAAKRSKDAADNESGSSPTTESSIGDTSSVNRRDYVKRIQGAYKDMKRNGDLNIGGKFNSKEHKSNISSLYEKLDQVHNIDLKRIPHIDKTLDIHNVVRGPTASTRLKLKKLNSSDIESSAEKVISEAEYRSLSDAYGACILYRYFFSLLKPYLDIPYVSSSK